MSAYKHSCIRVGWRDHRRSQWWELLNWSFTMRGDGRSTQLLFFMYTLGRSMCMYVFRDFPTSTFMGVFRTGQRLPFPQFWHPARQHQHPWDLSQSSKMFGPIGVVPRRRVLRSLQYQHMHWWRVIISDNSEGMPTALPQRPPWRVYRRRFGESQDSSRYPYQALWFNPKPHVTRYHHHHLSRLSLSLYISLVVLPEQPVFVAILNTTVTYFGHKSNRYSWW